MKFMEVSVEVYGFYGIFEGKSNKQTRYNSIKRQLKYFFMVRVIKMKIKQTFIGYKISLSGK